MEEFTNKGFGKDCHYVFGFLLGIGALHEVVIGLGLCHSELHDFSDVGAVL